MNVTSKSIVLIASVAAAGLFAVIDMAQSRPEPTPAATIEVRFPRAEEMLAQAKGPRGPIARPVMNTAPARDCVHEHWPYMADECLSGVTVPTPVRTIPIQRRVPSEVPAQRTTGRTLVASR
jgi:hypothetical protein